MALLLQFLALLRRQRLHRLEVEVVVQMEIVEILTMDQEIEHVVALTADLKTNLHPVRVVDWKNLVDLKERNKYLGRAKVKIELGTGRQLKIWYSLQRLYHKLGCDSCLAKWQLRLYGL